MLGGGGGVMFREVKLRELMRGEVMLGIAQELQADTLIKPNINDYLTVKINDFIWHS